MPASITRSFTATSTGVQTPTMGAPGSVPFIRYALQLKGTGAAATTWSVTLEGSLDNVNWTVLITHANADVDGTTKWESTGKACLFVRANVGTLTLGSATAIVATVVATS